MAKSSARNEASGADDDNEETRSLLSDNSSDIIVHAGNHNATKPEDLGSSRSPSLSPSPSVSPRPQNGGLAPPRRQSSFAQPRPPGTPRTPNRVRFEIDDSRTNGQVGIAANGQSPSDNRDDWMDEEDFMTSTNSPGRNGRHGEQRLPLLTGIEAPSVTVASSDVGFSPEDLLESARPKSGMKSAFMNMANSIM
jgi:solute carrier family 38 (sodium-coupled neutral amino acid transporter), member 11